MKAAWLFFSSCVVVVTSNAADWVTLDAQRYHLRSGTNAEWQEFAASSVHGSRLDVPFVATSNVTDHSIFLWQDDVKLDWRVEVNGRRIGALFLMESPLVHTLRLPAGVLRDGSNVLSILPPKANDDIRVGEIKLATRAVASVLSEAMVELRVIDEQSRRPLPSRITVTDAQGSLAALHTGSDVTIAARPGVVYTANGEATVSLLAGNYTFSATRGFEFSLATTNVSLKPGEQRVINLQLRREVATPGLISSDTHVHTFTHSRHGDATIHERAVTLAGEGIELPIATDHDIAVDIEPAASEARARNHFTPVVGDEVTTRVGHFNIFPVANGAKLPSNRETNWTVLLDSFRATPGVQMVIFNHPRNVHTGFQPFARTNFNRITGEPRWPFDFRVDAMELVNSSAQQSDYMSVFEDWFALLNAGHRIVAVGSSDGHDVSRYIVGQGRTFIEADDNDVSKIDVDAVCRNFKAGRAYVSMGLLPILTVNDTHRAGSVVTNAPATLKVNVRVLAPSWIAADRVELFANGIKIRTATITSRPRGEAGVAANVQWEIQRPPHDVHFVAIATGPGNTSPHWPIAKPYQPSSPQWISRVIGAANPVWVDADRDGKFSSARDYAQLLLQRAGGDMPALLASLRSYDEAVAVQAAAAARRSGLNIGSKTVQQALTGLPPAIVGAFNRVIEEEGTLPQ
jgi:hypothetical protein